MMERAGILVVFLLGLTTVLAVEEKDKGDTCNTTGLGTQIIAAETRLHNCLFKNYNKRARPVANYSDGLEIYFEIGFVRVIELFEKEEVLEISTILIQAWLDVQLKWDPSDYNGVDSLRVPVDELWTPEVALYNNAGGDEAMSTTNKLAIVWSNGTVIWVPMIRAQVFCPLQLRRYPFDTQECSVIFGTWTYNIQQTHFKTKSGGVEFDFPHKIWDVVVHKMESKFSYGSHTHSLVIVKVKMERKSNFQQVMMVGPGVLLATLLLLIFWIPPQTGERIQLGIGIIVIDTLLLLIMDNYLPVEITAMPIIGMYLFFIFFMTCVSLALSTIVMRCYHRDMSRSKVPGWVKSFFLSFLGRLVCVRPSSYTSVPSDVAVVNEGREMLAPHDLNLNTDQPLPRSPTLALEKVLEEIRLYLKMCATKESQPHPEMTSHKQSVVNEWHQVAVVLDRVFFVVYVVLVIIVTIAMLAH